MRLPPLVLLCPPPIERGPPPLGAFPYFPCCSLLRRPLTARGGLGIALDLRLECGNPLHHCRFHPRQLAAGLERGPARIRPHLSAIDPNLSPRHYPLRDPRRHAFGPQPVAEF